MSDPASLHNIAFVGHPSSGKTTLVDCLAYKTGASARKGLVADKTSICDTEPEEQEKQHTLQFACVHSEYGGKSWNFLDTPGYPEFVAQVQSAMFAADLVVGVVSCTSGPTFNLRTKLAAAAEMGRGRAVIVTHLDGENADFDATVELLRERVGPECVPVLLPNANGPAFDAVRRTVLDLDSPWCSRLKDRVMDSCDDELLLLEYLDTGDLSEEQLDAHMPAAIAKGSLVPVLVCDPLHEKATDSVLEFLKRFAPNPMTRATLDANGNELTPDRDAPLTATVFGVASDPHVGKVCMARIHQGTLHASDHVGLGKGEKPGSLFRLVGKDRDAIESAGPGELVAFSKVEKLGLWDSFGVATEEPVKVLVPHVPKPTVAWSLTPKSRTDEQKIGEALNKLAIEDPTFKIEHTVETHELVVHGMSDLHLQTQLGRLERRFHVQCDHNLPRVAYRQSVTKSAEGHHRHKKQSGGRGQFGECYLRIRPGELGTGIVFQDKVVGGAIPRNLIPAVEKGIREIAANGILIEGEVVDVEVDLYDGKFHPVDSDEASFRMAGQRAFREAFLAAKPVLLEPVMEVQIHAPSHDAGSIFSDVTSQRRGHVVDQSTEADGAITMIRAEVPLLSMQTYHRDLKSQTAGEGSYSMQFAKYGQVPMTEQKKILADSGKRHEDD